MVVTDVMVPTEPSADVVSNVVVEVVGLGRDELDEELLDVVVTESDEEVDDEDELSVVSGGFDELLELELVEVEVEVEVVVVMLVTVVSVVSVVPVVSVLGTSVSLLLGVVGALVVGGVSGGGEEVFSEPEVSPAPSVSFWRLNRILRAKPPSLTSGGIWLLPSPGFSSGIPNAWAPFAGTTVEATNELVASSDRSKVLKATTMLPMISQWSKGIKESVDSSFPVFVGRKRF